MSTTSKLTHSTNINYSLSPENILSPSNPPPKRSEEAQRIFEAIQSGQIFSETASFAERVSQIGSDELKEVLELSIAEMVANMDTSDPIEAAEKLAQIIPYETLDDMCIKRDKSSFKKARSMLHQAKYHLENREVQSSPSLKARISNVIDALITFIESFLSAFGIGDFFKPSSDQFEDNSKFYKVTGLISFNTMLTAALTPALGIELAAPIVASALIMITVLSVIWPMIAPIPFHLPCDAENWTKKCQNGELYSLSFSRGRKEVLDEIAATLIRSQKGQLKKHPLLKGESRVGKNETAKAFVQAIERGDYPELKGKKVFYINAAKLCAKTPPFGGKDPLELLKEAIGRHKEKIILVIDEIHTPFLDKKYATTSQKLKNMLDVDGAFPYVIGITTTKELTEKVGDDPAFINRFNPITIESTSSEVTQEILARSVLSRKETVLCAPNAIETIYKKTAQKPQPYTSSLLLGKCIELTSNKQQSSTTLKIQQLRNEKELHASRGVFSSLTIPEEDDVSLAIEDLETQIKALEETLAKENAKFNHLFERKESVLTAKTRIYQTVVKVAHTAKLILIPSDQSELKSFIILNEFLLPIMLSHISTEAENLGVKATIDETVIAQAMEALNMVEAG